MTEPSALVYRWGFEKKGPIFNWNPKHPLHPLPWSDCVQLQEISPNQWVVIREGYKGTLTGVHPEAWMAVEQARENSSLGFYPKMTAVQAQKLVALATRIGLPWTKVEPWGTPIPTVNQLEWLEHACLCIDPKASWELPKRVLDGVMLSHDDTTFRVSNQGELTIEVLQDSAAFRHFSQIQTAIERLDDLPLAQDLLQAVCPPEPPKSTEVVISAKISYKNEISFRRESLPSDRHIQRMICALDQVPQEVSWFLLQIHCLYRWAGENLPNLEPDMGLWYWEREHRLMWWHYEIGVNQSPSSFEITTKKSYGTSDASLRAWILALCPRIDLNEKVEQIMSLPLLTEFGA